MTKRKEGFTLIELMIVVVVVLATITAIAIPNMLSAKMHGNEASAITSLRAISTCNEQYRIRFGQYAADLDNLRGSGLLDESVRAGSKSGYEFRYVPGGSDEWECEAVPTEEDVTGSRSFFVDISGVIRVNQQGAADATSDPLDSGLLDESVRAGSKSGYEFRYVPGGSDEWECEAVPTEEDVTGSRSFFVDISGVIRVNQQGAADATSDPLD